MNNDNMIKAEIARLKQESANRINLIDKEFNKVSEKIGKLNNKILELDSKISELLADDGNHTDEIREIHISRYFRIIELKQTKIKRTRLISLRNMIITNSCSRFFMLK